MIDFHTHILPNIDDGSRNIEQTLKMVKEAQKAGFTKIIFTPHYTEGYYEVDAQSKRELFQEVCEEVHKQQNDLELYLATEVYIASDNFEELVEKDKILTINDTRYLLFELPMNSKPFNLYDIIYEMQRFKIKPVLAHPERYAFVQDEPEIIYDLIERGVFMQQNYGSIIGQYGKRAEIIARKMLETNSVHFLGSDVHREDSVYNNISKSIIKIKSIVGEEKFQEISTKNAELVLENQKIYIDTPDKIKLNLFEKIKMNAKQ